MKRRMIYLSFDTKFRKKNNCFSLSFDFFVIYIIFQSYTNQSYGSLEPIHQLVCCAEELLDIQCRIICLLMIPRETTLGKQKNVFVNLVLKER
jgi:hypothetical protein